MAHTQITINILRARTAMLQDRVNYLSALSAALQDENDALRGIQRPETPVDPKKFAALMKNMAAEDEANGIFDHLDPEERDYGLGGQEFVDPTNGKDTWHS